jgi:hypothetical protein
MKNPTSRATIAPRADGVVSPASQAALTPLVDELLDLYVSWREECASVAASYENWSASERRDNRLAFSAYLAALDREEHAATKYRGLVERIAEVHALSSAVAPRPASDEGSDPASVTGWGLRGIARNSRRRGS